MIVQVYVPSGGVEVDGGKDEMGYGDVVGGFGEQGKQGDVLSGRGVVGLVVDD